MEVTPAPVQFLLQYTFSCLGECTYMYLMCVSECWYGCGGRVALNSGRYEMRLTLFGNTSDMTGT